MKTCLKAIIVALIASGVVALGPHLRAGEPALRIESVQIAAGGPIEFTFVDTGTGATAYRVESSPDAGTSVEWEAETGAFIAPLGGGAHRVVISELPEKEVFFRVVALGASGEVVFMNFATTAFSVFEGETFSPVITFSAPFAGVIRYTVAGTAASGDIDPLSGEVYVDNRTSVAIPIAVSENETIDPHRVLILTLEAVGRAQTGLASRMVITINDRDARWEGALMTGPTALPFTLEIIRTGDSTYGRLLGGAAHLLPEGSFPATVAAFSETAFTASVEGIPLPSTTTLLGVPVVLGLTLRAETGRDKEAVGPEFIQGHAELHVRYPAYPHLDNTHEGSFLLQRTPPAPSERSVVLSPP